MKRLALAAICALGFAGPVVAQDGEPIGPTFNSRGECESFLARENNAARAEGSGGRTPSEQNRFTRENYSCEPVGDGKYRIFRKTEGSS
jgi:hypothetical protein